MKRFFATPPGLLVGLLVWPLALDGQAAGEEIYPGYLWTPVADGVFVHTRSDPLAGPVDGNSVVIVNDRDVFVIDTHINPAAARAVVRQIRAVTDQPVTHIVNTHWHDDHTNGNDSFRRAFPDARVVAHGATLRALEDRWEATLERRRTTYASVLGRDLIRLADSIGPLDYDRSTGVRLLASYRDALAPELKAMIPAYPDLLVSDSLVFDRGDRTIVLRYTGPGNTHGDLQVWLPEDGVLVSGDVLVAPVPFAFDAPIVEWVTTLRSLAGLDPRLVVPGHGEVQRGTGYMEQVAALLEATLAEVRKAQAAGLDYVDLAGAVDLRDQERSFTGGNAQRGYAWREYYYAPGLLSAWKSLGLEVRER